MSDLRVSGHVITNFTRKDVIYMDELIGLLEKTAALLEKQRKDLAAAKKSLASLRVIEKDLK